LPLPDGFFAGFGSFGGKAESCWNCGCCAEAKAAKAITAGRENFMTLSCASLGPLAHDDRKQQPIAEFIVFHPLFQTFTPKRT
jgi:hypothetical protein